MDSVLFPNPHCLVDVQWGMCLSNSSTTSIQNFVISFFEQCYFMLPFSDEAVGQDITDIKNVVPVSTTQFNAISRNPVTGGYDVNQFGYLALGI